MKRKHSLSHQKRIKNLFSEAKTTSSGFFRVLAADNGLNRARFLFVVGSVVSKKSSQRTLIRRRAREYVRKNLAYLLKQTKDIVVIAKTGTSGLDKKEFYEELQKVFDKAGFFKNN